MYMIDVNRWMYINMMYTDIMPAHAMTINGFRPKTSLSKPAG